MNTLRFKGWLVCMGAVMIALFAAPALRAQDSAADKPAVKTEEEGKFTRLLKSTGLYGFFKGTDIMEKNNAEHNIKVFKEIKLRVKDPASVTLEEARLMYEEVTNAHGMKDKKITAEELAGYESKLREALLGPVTAEKAKAGIEAILYGKNIGYEGLFPKGIGQFIMILVGILLIYLAIAKDFEPLLLLPIGFGGILANIPLAGITDEGGFLYIIYNTGVSNGLFPLIIFMGVGAMTDFGPLIANPKTALLGAAAQFGIFTTLIGAIALGFAPNEAASIGIIGGADGPTSIFVTSKLAPHLLGAIAVAAYSYMALVPVIQPPIMRWLVPSDERKIEMKQLRHVSKAEKIVFPLLVLGLCILLLPDACPLIGALMFGNLAKESGAVDRLSNCMQNELINIVTIFLGLSVGSKLSAEKFLTGSTLKILILGLLAFCVGTAAGLLLARIMNAFSKDKINPLIGSAGVSAVPMAARVANKVGLENNPHNFLLMHAMGPNVAGVIGSAVAAGILLSVVGN